MLALFFVREHVDVKTTYDVPFVCRTMTYVCDMTDLKPNGISHTVMPEDFAKDYNEWMEHITASSIKRDADTFKEKFRRLVGRHFIFRNADEADDYKRKFDALWDKFTKKLKNQLK